MVDSFASFVSLVPLALTSGVNLYATILILGFSERLGLIPHLPPGLAPLTSIQVMLVAGALYLIEFAADKIPFVDNAWDTIHTIIRPIGALAIASGLLVDAEPEVRAIAALIAGGTALTAHTGKAGLRLALNIASPVENFSNVTVSLVEDIGVAVLVILVLLYPLAALIIALLLLAAMIVLLPLLLRWSWFRVRSVLAAVHSLISPQTVSEPLPCRHLMLLDGQTPTLSIRCKVQGIDGVHGKSGYLSLMQGSLCFTYDRRGTQRWMLDFRQIAAAELRRGLLLDKFVIQSDNARPITFIFLKDRAPLVKQLAAQLHDFASSKASAHRLTNAAP